MEHFVLKQIGKYLLKNKGCKVIGTEIDIGYDPYINKEYRNTFRPTRKQVIDVVGLNCSNYNWRGKCLSIGMEAKVSLNDFKNGFCTKCDRTYVIAPVGVIPIELVPKDIGLIEVDFEKYKPTDMFDMSAVQETRIAKRRKVQQDYINLVYSIANRFTNEDLYTRCQLKLYAIDDRLKEEHYENVNNL
jgi:hypothetical protein